MCRNPICTLNRPFKRRVHNNYFVRFQRSTAVTASRSRNRRFSQLLDALEVRNTINTRPCSILLRVGGPCARSARPYCRSSAGRAPSLPSPRTKHVLPYPRRKSREGRSTHNSPAKFHRWCDFCTDSRSFLCASIQIARYHLSPTSSGRCGRTRRAGGGQGRCLGLSADAQRSVRVCMPFCGVRERFSHSRPNSCISRTNA